MTAAARKKPAKKRSARKKDLVLGLGRTGLSVARYLARIRSARVFQRAQQEIHGLLQSIPLIGSKAAPWMTWLLVRM